MGSSGSSDARMEEELDGLPVFGTDDDDWEMDSTFSQRVFSQLDRNSDDEDKNDSRDGAPTTVANPGKFTLLKSYLAYYLRTKTLPFWSEILLAYICVFQLNYEF